MNDKKTEEKWSSLICGILCLVFLMMGVLASEPMFIGFGGVMLAISAIYHTNYEIERLRRELKSRTETDGGSPRKKKLPRSVKAFLLILGFWGGCLMTFVGSAIGMIYPLALWIVIGIFAVSLVIYYVLTWKYEKTLIQWGMISPKKRDKKK